jgi:hypothetical protein
MALNACLAAALMSFASVPAAEERPALDVAMQSALGLYLGEGLPSGCDGPHYGCAAGASIGIQVGLRLTNLIDVVAGFRRAWTDSPTRIDQPALGVAFWPATSGLILPRIYALAGPLFVPGRTGVQAQAGLELMVVPAKWFGIGVVGETAKGWMGGWGLGALHAGVVMHLRL